MSVCVFCRRWVLFPGPSLVFQDLLVFSRCSCSSCENSVAVRSGLLLSVLVVPPSNLQMFHKAAAKLWPLEADPGGSEGP